MTTNQPKNKAVLYCRVSSKEQEETGYSLPSQEKLLKDYAERKGFAVAKVFAIAESASGVKQRKVFDEMIKFAEKNRANNVLCEKVDRLTRNLKDAVAVNDWLEENPERQIHFVKMNLVIHKGAQSNDKFRWDIEIVLAKKYIANLSEEIRKGQKEKIAQGWLPTKPPLGYKTVGEKGRRTQVIDETVAPHIRKMFSWYATGNYTLSRLEVELYEAGLRTRSGKKLGISRIHLMLSEPFYYGKICWNNDITQGKQEALISKDIFDKVQTILKRKTKNPHFATHNSLFKAKINCEHCGGLVTWERQKGHWYGHCNNHGAYRKCAKKTYIREERVEEQLIGFFEKIAPKSDAVLEVIEDIIRKENAEIIIERENEISRLHGLLASVRKQKDKYFEAKIDEKAPLEFCERKIAECIDEESSLESALVLASDKSDEYQQLRLVIHELAYKAKEIYEKATIDEKRLLFTQIFTNIVQDGLQIKPNYTLAAEYLATWAPKLNKNYELEKRLTTKAKTGNSVPVSTVWCARQESNLYHGLRRPAFYPLNYGRRRNAPSRFTWHTFLDGGIGLTSVIEFVGLG